MAINQNISQFPPAPDSGTDTPQEFSTKADAFVEHQADIYINEVNQWAIEANSTASTVNDNATDAQNSADAAAQSETNAKTSETNAGNSASSAQTAEANAANSEANAEESANNAATSETNAANSATAAEQSKNAAQSAANYKGEWDNATAYTVGESVSLSGIFYMCKQDNTGNDPSTSPDYWESTEMGEGIYVRLDGTSSMEASFDAGSHPVVNVGENTDSSSAATYGQLSAHSGAKNNPHSVTAAQVGADAAGTAQAVQDNLDTHEADTSNPHSVTKDQVGLDKVDNTSDADKPVSTAQQAALDDKASLISENNYSGHYQINSTLKLISGVTLDFNQGTVLQATLSGDNTIAFTNIPGSGFVEWIVLLDAKGYSVTWPTGTTWDGDGTEPEWSDGIDMIYFYTTNGGTSIHGMRTRAGA